jgi:hypothetical protein
MARWRSKSGNIAEESSPDGSPAERTAQRSGRHRPGPDLRAALTRITGLLATAVAVAATVIAVLLALHIAFVVFSANHGNPIVRTVDDWADRLAWEFRDMFTPKDRRVAVLVNYGIAAVVYLVAGRVGAGLIRRIR